MTYNIDKPVTFASTLRRYPVVALLPLVVFVAAGIAIGLKRHPQYTASTELNVGSPQIAAQATPGFVEATVTLASAYSREVTSHNIWGPVSRKLKLPAQAVRSRLSTSTVPTSSTFYINATGSSASSAISLANTATAALRREINTDQQGQDDAPRLLRQYQAAQNTANQLDSTFTMLQTRYHATAAALAALPGAPPKPTLAQVRSAQLAAQVATLQASTLSGRYASASSSAAGPVIELLNPASTAASDRRTVTERYGLIGAAAGIVAGLALILLLTAIRTRRTAAKFESAPSPSR